MGITEAESQEEVKEILARARKEPMKGRHYIYEIYKSELIDVCVSSLQLERAIIELARALHL